MHSKLPWSNAFWLGLTPFGPPVWQAQADTELTSTSPTAAVDQKVLHLAKRRKFTIKFECSKTFKFSKKILFK